MASLLIREDDLSGAAIGALLQEHLDEMRAITPPGGVYALDRTALRAPEVTVWSAWMGEYLVGCGALKQLDPKIGELKSMRTATAHQRQGVGSKILRHIIREAGRRGYVQLLLETGGEEPFASVRAWYARHGFQTCGAFADYPDDPRSAFMALEISEYRPPH